MTPRKRDHLPWWSRFSPHLCAVVTHEEAVGYELHVHRDWTKTSFWLSHTDHVGAKKISYPDFQKIVEEKPPTWLQATALVKDVDD